MDLSAIDMDKIVTLQKVGSKLNKKDYVPNLIQTFYEDGQKILKEVSAPLGDNEKFKLAADGIHRFKGSCGFFGAVGLEDYCARVEDLLRSQQLDPESREFSDTIASLTSGLESFYVKISQKY